VRRLPLSGVRVLDFGIGGVGPWAGSQLAQLGATVVKVEAPNEFILEVLPRWRTATTTYRALNLCKRSVKLNLKDQTDLDTAWTLVDGADVMLENFRSGAIGRMGFGFDDVRARNPRIVYCSANGFGSEGDMAGLACIDPHMQAFSGFASLNGSLPDGERLRFYGAIDLFTSGLIVEAVLAALIQRERTGEAQQVEVTMLGGATTAMLSQLADRAVRSGQAAPMGHQGRYVHPDGLYRTLDRQVAVTVEDDETFRRFCDAIGRPDLFECDEFNTAQARIIHRDALDGEIEKTLPSLPAEWWLIALRRARVPSAPVHYDHELMAHYETWQRGHIRRMEDFDPATGDAMLVAGPPWEFEGIPAEAARSPYPGKHNDTLHRNGDSWDELSRVSP
jgi:crotonobetainyl-CoA:carnitine CoA-transferase CaiB-like acyl-CoA transferase